MNKNIIEDYSWIVGGSQRIKIIKNLTKIKTPKEISVDTELKFSNVSDALTAMTKRKIIECLTPKNHLGRLYKLTKKGELIRKELSN